MTTSDGKVGWQFWAVGAAVAGGAAYLALRGIGSALWLDDTHSTYHAFAGPGSVVQNLRTDSHPPVYFWVLSLWMAIGGLGESWLRVPSILFTLGAATVVSLEARRSGGAQLAWVVAALFLFHPVVGSQIHTVRPYALAGLLAAVSTVAYLRLARAEGVASPVVWTTYLAANVLGTLTHYWFFLLLSGQGLGALLFARGKARWQVPAWITASAVPFALFWTPVLLEQTRGTPTSWLDAPDGFWLVGAPLALLGGSDFMVEEIAFLAVVAVACVVRLTPRPTLRTPHELAAVLGDRDLLLSATLPVVVMVLAFALSQVTPVYHVRYTIVAIPAVALVIGRLLTGLGERALVPAVCLLFAGGSLVLQTIVRDRELELDSRAVTRGILDEYRGGDAVVHVTLNYAPTLHYLRALAPDRDVAQVVFPQEVAGHVGWRDPGALRADTVALRGEAAQLTQALLARTGSGRLWVLPDFDKDSAVTRVLLSELERGFELSRTVAVKGWWVSEVRIYTERPYGPSEVVRVP